VIYYAYRSAYDRGSHLVMSSIPQSVFNFLGSWNSLSQSGGWSIWPTNVVDSACTNLLSLAFENTTILSASYVSAGSYISTPGSCQSTASSTVDICRVYAMVNTTSDSSLKLEIWMPDTWYGRILTIGNRGIGGCQYPSSDHSIARDNQLLPGIGYEYIDYGASLHFATIGSDNGHDGMTGVPFLNHPEVIHDYAHRSVHVATAIGKQVVEAYYRAVPSKSYFLGCSTGGRQGVQSALMYPEDYDGIVSGAPLVNINHYLGWIELKTRYLGAPHGESSPAYISSNLLALISKEILRQCDTLDGMVDGIISEPDDCDFDPQTLLCAEGATNEGCLTQPQIDALRKLYSPLHGSDGSELYPRFDPGSEQDPFVANNIFTGRPYTFSNVRRHSSSGFC
jgi:feruloyl esterase